MPSGNAPTSRRLLSHGAMIAYAGLIAGSFSIGHVAAPHLTPAALNLMRFIFGTVVFGICVFAWYRRPIWPQMALWKLGLLGALMASYFVLMFVALRMSGPISTGAVFTLIPFMSTIFGVVLLGQKPTLLIVLSLLIAACGAIWVIFGGDVNAILRLSIGKGEAIFLVGCAGLAAYAPLARKFAPEIPFAVYTFWNMIATTLCIALVGTADMLATDWSSLPAIVWIAIGYLSIFTTAGTFFLLHYSVQYLPSSKVMAYGYLTPGFIILIEGIVGHGWASLSVFAGALVTICGLLVLAVSRD